LRYDDAQHVSLQAKAMATDTQADTYRPAPGRRSALWRWLVVVAILALYTALVVRGLDYYAWHDDESVFALTSKAVYEGHGLYRDIWFNYPPGFIQYLALAHHLLGYSLTTARLAVFVGGLVALAAVGLLAREQSRPWAGVAAILMLAVMPHFVVLSTAAMTEVPALALATLGVWLAVRYSQRGGLGWLLASGAVLSVALYFKPTMWPALTVPGIAILYVARKPLRILRHGLLFSCALLIPFAIGVLLTNPTQFAHQFWVTYRQSQEAFPLELWRNIRHQYQYLFADNYRLQHIGLVLLDIVGFVALWQKRRVSAVMMAGWLGVTLFALITHTPMYRHHQIVLLLPLSTVAGVGLVATWHWFRSARVPWHTYLAGAILVATFIELKGDIWAAYAVIQAREDDFIDVSRQATDWLVANTQPDDYVITDGQIIAIRANREVPINIANTSRMRIYTGELTDQQMIDAAREYDPAAVIFWEKKLDSTDDFAAWVACHYDLTVGYDERHRIYAPRPVPQLPDTLQRLDQPIGAQILLLGYAWNGVELVAGAELQLDLYWEALERPDSDYKVFVHILDREGNIIAQEDARPRQWMCPTWVWQPGERIEDSHVLALDSLGTGGPFVARIGLYDHYTGARLAPDHILIPLTPQEQE